MKVKELIERLKKCDPDEIVVLAKDAEGNAYEELYDINAGQYAYSPDYREVGFRSSDVLPNGGTEEDLAPSGSHNCVIFWP